MRLSIRSTRAAMVAVLLLLLLLSASQQQLNVHMQVEHQQQQQQLNPQPQIGLQDWLLRPPRFHRRNWPLSTPLCTHWNPYLCYVYSQDVKLARTRQKKKKRKVKYKCPASTLDPVRVYLRDWPGGWQDAVTKITNTKSCPQKCQVETIPISNISIIVDAYSSMHDQSPWLASQSGDDPSILIALLELEDHTFVQGSMLRRLAIQSADMYISYTRESDVWINYMYAYSHFTHCADEREDPRMDPIHHFANCLPPVTAKGKDFIVAFVSNCGRGGDMSTDVDDLWHGLDLAPLRGRYGNSNPGSIRAMFLGELLQELQLQAPAGRSVINYGSCHHHVVSPHTITSPDKADVLPRFKFTLAFENSWRPDYVTEKLFQALVYGTVPIVFGSPETFEFLPGGRGSYIDVADFTSPADLAQYLIKLDSDDDEYLKFFAWRQRNVSTWNPMFFHARGFDFVGTGRESFACRVCAIFARDWCGDDTIPEVLVGGYHS